MFCRLKTFKCGRKHIQILRGFALSNKNYSDRFAMEKKLFTPGPLGVSWSTKHAMMRDLGSRDKEFIAIVKHIRHELLELAGVSNAEYTSVPIQGSGTFAIEAVITTTVPPNGKVMVIENGAYGKRQMKICETLKIPYTRAQFPENEMVCPDKIEKLLRSEPGITNVAVVHCETSSGVINPIKDIGRVIKAVNPNISYFVDAMSSFGAIPFSVADCHIDYMVSSANKCIEGVPGFAYAICRKDHLMACKGYARSYSLDLVDQYEGLESTSQFRFTPPTHAMLAFEQALIELRKEGGIEGRRQRYKQNKEVLKLGMTKLGFEEFLDEKHDGYIITSYKFPKDENFNFPEFYNRLATEGQVIYPGKVLDADCFRIGNIGHLFPDDMNNLLASIRTVCIDMGIKLPVQY